MIEIVGSIAGALGVILFLPQLHKTIKTKNVTGISKWTYVIILVNLTLWVSYGIGINNPIIYIPNFMGLILCIIILTLLHDYSRNSNIEKRGLHWYD